MNHLTNAFIAVPTRNTTYSHLRDGFVRALEKRQWIAQQAGELSSDEQLKLQAPIGQLRSAFPNIPMVKGTPLDLVLAPPDSKQPRTLIIWDLGAIQNGWVAQELFLSFFDRQGNSPAVCIHIDSHRQLNLMRSNSLSSPSSTGSHNSRCVKSVSFVP